MADKESKKRSRDGDIDADIDLHEFDDLSLDNPEGDGTSPGSGRKPSSPLKTALIAGMKGIGGGVAAGIKGEIYKAVPTLEAINSDIATSYSEFKDLKDELATQLGPMITTIEDSTRKVLPKAKKLLPKKLYEKIDKKLTDRANERAAGSYSAPSKEQMERETIQDELASIFSEQQQLAQTQALEQKKSDLTAMALEGARHKQNVAQLTHVYDAVRGTEMFHRTIHTAYLKKSLELKYKHLFVAKDTFNLLSRSMSTFESYFKAITRNTSLPDMMKVQVGDIDKKRRTDKYGTMMADFMGKAREKIFEKIKSKAKDAVQSFGMFADTVGMAADMSSMMDGMPGGDQSGGLGGLAAKGIGHLIGRFGAGPLAKRYLGKIKPLTDNLDDTLRNAKAGASLKVANIGRNWAASDNRLLQFLADFLPQINPQTTGGNALITDADKPAVFDTMTRQSIVEIIPGYLAKILNSMEKSRTGNEDLEEQIYNVYDRRFTTVSELKAGMENKLYGSESTRRENFAKALGSLQANAGKTKAMGAEVDPKEYYRTYRKDINRVLVNHAVFAEFLDLQKIGDYVSSQGQKRSTYIDRIIAGLDHNPVEVLQALYRGAIDEEGKLDRHVVNDLNSVINNYRMTDSYKAEMPKLFETYGYREHFADKIGTDEKKRLIEAAKKGDPDAKKKLKDALGLIGDANDINLRGIASSQADIDYDALDKDIDFEQTRATERYKDLAEGDKQMKEFADKAGLTRAAEWVKQKKDQWKAEHQEETLFGPGMKLIRKAKDAIDKRVNEGADFVETLIKDEKARADFAASLRRAGQEALKEGKDAGLDFLALSQEVLSDPKAAMEKLQKMGMDKTDEIVSALSKRANRVADEALSKLKELKTKATDLYNEKTPDSVKNAIVAVKQLAEKAPEQADILIGRLEQAYEDHVPEDVKQKIAEVRATIEQVAKEKAAKVSEVAKDVASKASDIADKAVDAAKNVASKIAGKTGDKDIDAAVDNAEESGDIPKFAHGGVVTKPTLAVVGERGPEVISPVSDDDAVDENFKKLVQQYAAERQAKKAKEFESPVKAAGEIPEDNASFMSKLKERLLGKDKVFGEIEKSASFKMTEPAWEGKVKTNPDNPSYYTVEPTGDKSEADLEITRKQEIGTGETEKKVRNAAKIANYGAKGLREVAAGTRLGLGAAKAVPFLNGLATAGDAIDTIHRFQNGEYLQGSLSALTTAADAAAFIPVVGWGPSYLASMATGGLNMYLDHRKTKKGKGKEGVQHFDDGGFVDDSLGIGPDGQPFTMGEKKPEAILPMDAKPGNLTDELAKKLAELINKHGSNQELMDLLNGWKSEQKEEFDSMKKSIDDVNETIKTKPMGGGGGGTGTGGGAGAPAENVGTWGRGGSFVRRTLMAGARMGGRAARDIGKFYTRTYGAALRGAGTAVKGIAGLAGRGIEALGPAAKSLADRLPETLGLIGGGLKNIGKGYLSVYNNAIKTAGKTVSNVATALFGKKAEPYEDIYRKDEIGGKYQPILTRLQQERDPGVFFKDGKRVKMSSDIHEPVYDVEGKPLISQEDIDHGLVGGDGKPLHEKLGSAGIIGTVLGIGKALAPGVGKGIHSIADLYKNVYSKLFGFALDGAKGLGKMAGNFVNRLFGFDVGGTSKKLIELVTLLQQDVDLIAQGKKKNGKAGDADGDGDVDGSYADQMEKQGKKEYKTLNAADEHKDVNYRKTAAEKAAEEKGDEEKGEGLKMPKWAKDWLKKQKWVKNNKWLRHGTRRFKALGKVLGSKSLRAAGTAGKWLLGKGGMAGRALLPMLGTAGHAIAGGLGTAGSAIAGGLGSAGSALGGLFGLGGTAAAGAGTAAAGTAATAAGAGAAGAGALGTLGAIAGPAALAALAGYGIYRGVKGFGKEATMENLGIKDERDVMGEDRMYSALGMNSKIGAKAVKGLSKIMGIDAIVKGIRGNDNPMTEKEVQQGQKKLARRVEKNLPGAQEILSKYEKAVTDHDWRTARQLCGKEADGIFTRMFKDSIGGKLLTGMWNFTFGKKDEEMSEAEIKKVHDKYNSIIKKGGPAAKNAEKLLSKFDDYVAEGDWKNARKMAGMEKNGLFGKLFKDSKGNVQWGKLAMTAAFGVVGYGAGWLLDKKDPNKPMTEEEVKRERARLQKLVNSGNKQAQKILDQFDEAVTEMNWKKARKLVGKEVISNLAKFGNGVKSTAKWFNRITTLGLSMLFENDKNTPMTDAEIKKFTDKMNFLITKHNDKLAKNKLEKFEEAVAKENWEKARQIAKMEHKSLITRGVKNTISFWFGDDDKEMTDAEMTKFRESMQRKIKMGSKTAQKKLDAFEDAVGAQRWRRARAIAQAPDDGIVQSTGKAIGKAAAGTWRFLFGGDGASMSEAEIEKARKRMEWAVKENKRGAQKRLDLFNDYVADEKWEKARHLAKMPYENLAKRSVKAISGALFGDDTNELKPEEIDKFQKECEQRIADGDKKVEKILEKFNEAVEAQHWEKARQIAGIKDWGVVGAVGKGVGKAWDWLVGNSDYEDCQKIKEELEEKALDDESGVIEKGLEDFEKLVRRQRYNDAMDMAKDLMKLKPHEAAAKYKLGTDKLEEYKKTADELDQRIGKKIEADKSWFSLSKMRLKGLRNDLKNPGDWCDEFFEDIRDRFASITGEDEYTDIDKPDDEVVKQGEQLVKDVEASQKKFSWFTSPIKRARLASLYSEIKSDVMSWSEEAFNNWKKTLKDIDKDYTGTEKKDDYEKGEGTRPGDDQDPLKVEGGSPFKPEDEDKLRTNLETQTGIKLQGGKAQAEEIGAKLSSGAKNVAKAIADGVASIGKEAPGETYDSDKLQALTKKFNSGKALTPEENKELLELTRKKNSGMAPSGAVKPLRNSEGDKVQKSVLDYYGVKRLEKEPWLKEVDYAGDPDEERHAKEAFMKKHPDWMDPTQVHFDSFDDDSVDAPLGERPKINPDDYKKFIGGYAMDSKAPGKVTVFDKYGDSETIGTAELTDDEARDMTSSYRKNNPVNLLAHTGQNELNRRDKIFGRGDGHGAVGKAQAAKFRADLPNARGDGHGIIGKAQAEAYRTKLDAEMAERSPITIDPVTGLIVNKNVQAYIDSQKPQPVGPLASKVQGKAVAKPGSPKELAKNFMSEFSSRVQTLDDYEKLCQEHGVAYNGDWSNFEFVAKYEAEKYADQNKITGRFDRRDFLREVDKLALSEKLDRRDGVVKQPADTGTASTTKTPPTSTVADKARGKQMSRTAARSVNSGAVSEVLNMSAQEKLNLLDVLEGKYDAEGYLGSGRDVAMLSELGVDFPDDPDEWQKARESLELEADAEKAKADLPPAETTTDKSMDEVRAEALEKGSAKSVTVGPDGTVTTRTAINTYNSPFSKMVRAKTAKDRKFEDDLAAHYEATKAAAGNSFPKPDFEEKFARGGFTKKFAEGGFADNMTGRVKELGSGVVWSILAPVAGTLIGAALASLVPVLTVMFGPALIGILEVLVTSEVVSAYEKGEYAKAAAFALAGGVAPVAIVAIFGLLGVSGAVLGAGIATGSTVGAAMSLLSSVNKALLPKFCQDAVDKAIDGLGQIYNDTVGAAINTAYSPLGGAVKMGTAAITGDFDRSEYIQEGETALGTVLNAPQRALQNTMGWAGKGINMVGKGIGSLFGSKDKPKEEESASEAVTGMTEGIVNKGLTKGAQYLTGNNYAQGGFVKKLANGGFVENPRTKAINDIKTKASQMAYDHKKAGLKPYEDGPNSYSNFQDWASKRLIEAGIKGRDFMNLFNRIGAYYTQAYQGEQAVFADGGFGGKFLSQATESVDSDGNSIVAGEAGTEAILPLNNRPGNLLARLGRKLSAALKGKFIGPDSSTTTDKASVHAAEPDAEPLTNHLANQLADSVRSDGGWTEQELTRPEATSVADAVKDKYQKFADGGFQAPTSSPSKAPVDYFNKPKSGEADVSWSNPVMQGKLAKVNPSADSTKELATQQSEQTRKTDELIAVMSHLVELFSQVTGQNGLKVDGMGDLITASIEGASAAANAGGGGGSNDGRQPLVISPSSQALDIDNGINLRKVQQ